MAMWLSNSTDGVWGLRFTIMAFFYILGVIIGIFLMPQFYYSQFLSSQIVGISFLLASIFVIILVEKRMYPIVQDI